MERDRRPNGGERSLCYRTTKHRISHLRKPEPVAKEGVSQTGIPLQDAARVSFEMAPFKANVRKNTESNFPI